MRRLCAILLVLVLLTGCGYAEVSAYDIAAELAAVFEQISDVRETPLDSQKNRVIWNDDRTNGTCSLVVFESEDAAEKAELADATRSTATCAVKDCVLYLDTDMGADAILDYRLALMEILGDTEKEEEPDYMLNVNTKKFHYPGCSSVQQMKETNKQAFTGDRKDVVAQGYAPCKRCNP